MKRLLLGSLLFSVVSITGCEMDKEIPAILAGDTNVDYPVADFEYTISETNPQKFSFKSTSSKYTSLYWQLGDDSLSTAEEFEHEYKSFGRFKIILTARNEKGFSSKKETSIYLRNPEFSLDSIGENYMLTKGGQLTVFRENDGGADGNEGSSKLVNGNFNDKFFPGYDPKIGTWWKFQFMEPVVAQAYSLASPGDAPNRDPISWTFEGSNDDENWTVLDIQTESLWPINPGTNAPRRRHQRIFHITSNEIGFSYYRMNITKNNGAPGGIHLAEWTINASQP